MRIHYDLEKLSQALTDFYRVTGIMISLCDTDFRRINTAKGAYNPLCKLIQSSTVGCDRCKASDDMLYAKCKESKKYALHACHAGLIDVAVPLIYEGLLIGYIILGQIRRDHDFSSVYRKLADLNIDYIKAEQAYYDLVAFDAGKIESIVNTAVMLTKYILFEDMIQFQHNHNLDTAMRYIEENLSQELSVKQICKHTHLSKNVLYGLFRSNLGCTLGEYILDKRIRSAKEYLKAKEYSVEQIAMLTGFSGGSYFCKQFKKQTGMTPLQYRKQIKTI